MPKVTPGGRGYRPNPHPFNAHDSNTICDVTGFRVKVSEVVKRWEGFMVIKAAWHPRQPQDFPVVPVKQHTYREARRGNADADIDVTEISSADIV